MYGERKQRMLVLGRIAGRTASDLACFMNSIVYAARAARRKGIYAWSMSS